MDKRDELQIALSQKESFCEDQTKSFQDQIKQMEGELTKQRTKLATSTESQNTAESGSHTNSQAHAALAADFAELSKECCDNQNAMNSEICALGKIRGELNNAKEKVEGLVLTTGETW